MTDHRQIDPSALQPLIGEGPKTLFATVGGAHLYGFPSADSDIDLRGAFVRPLNTVLGLGPHKDTWEFSESWRGLDVDWVAHDVLKFVDLISKRHGHLLEQLYSPLVVSGGPFFEELRELGRGCIIRPLYYHYSGFYQNQRKLLTGGRVSAKVVLGAYRVLLTGIHLLRSAEILSHLPTLLEAYPLPKVNELITLKADNAENSGLNEALVSDHHLALEKLEERLNSAFESSRLPEKIEHHHSLSDYVVRVRKTLGVAGGN